MDRFLESLPQPFAACVEQLGGVLDLLPRLEHTPQDPAWHGEGDVAAHVTLVLEALERELATTDVRLQPDQLLGLRLAALLHDIAKPLVTRKETVGGAERVVSPHHTVRGAGYLAFSLPELRLPPAVLFDVLELVRNHHRPQFLIRRDDPRARIRRLARRAPLRSLYLLGLADTRGRIAEDRAAAEEAVHLFRLACEEGGGWDGAAGAFAPFVRDVASALSHRPLPVTERIVSEGLWDLDRGRISTAEEALACHHEAIDRDPPRVVVTCGPSGAGKSSWIARHHDGWEAISMDALRREVTGERSDQRENRQVFKLARQRLRQQLRISGSKTVWDATSLRRDMRSGVLQTAHAYGAHTTLVVLCPPLSVIWARNRERDHPVPEPVLRRQLEGYQWPEPGEAHRTIYVDGEGRVIRDTRQEWQGWADANG